MSANVNDILDSSQLILLLTLFFHKNTILHLKGATKRVVLVAVFKYGVLPHYHDVGYIHDGVPSLFRKQLLQRMLQFCFIIQLGNTAALNCLNRTKVWHKLCGRTLKNTHSP